MNQPDHRLADWHVQVLQWFETHEGEFFEDRPVNVGLSIPVTDPYGKGIRKPDKRLTNYALSVYQSWKGPYPDQPPIEWGDGQWTYIYHQEGPPSEDPKVRSTNRGLLDCMEDRVPVGVLLPYESSGRRGYKTMGLAMVDDYSNGCFVLTGPVSISSPSVLASVGLPLADRKVALIDFPAEEFDPDRESDERQKVIAEVVRRRGQPRFRSLLLLAYESRCCVTRYDAPQALEAAHIINYKGGHSNHPENGLLLRADIHDLFDVGMLGVRPDDMAIVCAPGLVGTRYEELHDERIHLPSDHRLRPNERALYKHLEMAGLV